MCVDCEKELPSIVTSGKGFFVAGMFDNYAGAGTAQGDIDDNILHWGGESF